MTATTATVETLTAEVRTLMVGSRQVTLSVAKQLDWVPVHEMEPFGRVRVTAGSTWAELIGRHRTTGALVCANNSPPPAPGQFHEWASRAEYDEAVAAYPSEREAWEARCALPLIVLAGLR
jgi:hypothetical protein